MNWRARRTRNTERRDSALARPVGRGGGHAAWHALVAMLWCALATAPLGAAAAEPARFAFAVIGNAFGPSPNSEANTQKMIDAIGRDSRVAFVVYDGNLTGGNEPCSDALYTRREAMLDASRPAMIFVPGQHDWVTCSTAGPGGYDPDERLDQLRQTVFSDSSTLGQNPLPLTRESEVSRFRPYHENVRWDLGGAVFLALNVPAGDNHYLYGGGRNGEFEDRVIANAFWLEHAAEYARRHNAHAIVIFVQGNPWEFERRERSERFGWLRFGHHPRDGYLEFRHSLALLAQRFRGPVLVVHEDDAKFARGFEIDQPLRTEKGTTIANVTRIAIGLHSPATQWLHVDVDMGKRPPLRIGVRDVPKYLPPLPPQQIQPLLPDGESPALPDMPDMSSMPDVTEIPAQPPYPPYPPYPPQFQTVPGSPGLPAGGSQPAVPAPPPGAGAIYRN